MSKTLRLLPLLLLALVWSVAAQAKQFVEGHFLYETVDDYNKRIVKTGDPVPLPDVQNPSKSVVLIGVSADGTHGCHPANERKGADKNYLKDKNHYTFSGTVTVPNTVKDDKNNEYPVVGIGGFVFYQCGQVTAVKLGENIQRIGSFAFYGTGIKTLVTPASLTTIKNNAFENCKSLTSVKLAEGLVTMTGNAFNGCDKLVMVNLPTTYKNVGGGCFSGCTALKYVSLGGNPDFGVSSNAFYGDGKLEKLLLVGECADPSKIDVTGNEDFKKATLYVPNTTPEKMAQYRALGFAQVVPVVDETSIKVGAYGSTPEATLNLTKWDKDIRIDRIYFTKHPDNKCPAGTYTHEPITVELFGGLLTGVKVVIYADFRIEPLPLDAWPYHHNDEENEGKSFTYGQPISFQAKDWMVHFDENQFYPGEDRRNIDPQYITIELYKDGHKVSANSEGHYDAGRYEVRGRDEKYASGPYAGLSKCNSTYDLRWKAYGEAVVNKTVSEGVDWKFSGELTVGVGKTKAFQAATCKTKALYAVEKGELAELVQGKTEVRGLKVGDTRLMAWADEDNNHYESGKKYMTLHVVRNASDLDWPTPPTPHVEAGGECLDIDPATSQAPVTYTVEGQKSKTPTAKDGSYVVTTDYATVKVYKDGHLEVCGKHQGQVKITACNKQTAEMESKCETITVIVDPATPRSLDGIIS